MSKRNPKFSGLDEALVAAIKSSPGITFHGLSVVADVEREADRIAADQTGPKRPKWRTVDARLQAIRKAGLVVFERGGWHPKG